MIAMIECKSKMLQAYGYSPATQTLAVRFGPDKVYEYPNVPQEVYDEFHASDSIGSAFARLIRNQYQHNIVLDEPKKETDGISQ